MIMNTIPAHKDQPLEAGIAHRKALTLLERHANKTSGGRFIPFPECKRILSHLFHLSRDEVFVFLGEMEEQGLCTIIPYHGIKISSKGKRSQQRR